MTTFIFGDYIYETPIFVIKALKKAEIPEALEQMEKLRRTGFLVGYIRYDAVSPVPDEEMQPDPHFEPAPYVHFVLFRHRRKLPELKPAGPAFCPSFSKHVSLRTMETMRGAVLSSNADADVEVSQEAVFSTACPGRAVYDHFVRLNPAAPHIYFKDDFEELICLSDRKLLETEKKRFWRARVHHSAGGFRRGRGLHCLTCRNLCRERLCGAQGVYCHPNVPQRGCRERHAGRLLPRTRCPGPYRHAG